MSLARLLSAGKSLVGGMDNTIRYRMGNPGMLPKFGSGKNPFRSAANRREPMQLIQPPEPDAESPKPALSPPAAITRQPREGESMARAVPVTPALAAAEPCGQREKQSSRAPNWGSALRAIWRGWLAAVKERLPRRTPKRTRSGISQLAKPLVQPELSLDKVKVLRNDLSETDLEVVPVAAPMVLKIETVTKSGRGNSRQDGEPRRSSGRPDEVKSSNGAVSLTAMASGKGPIAVENQ